jgi:chromosome segregation ATPase
MDDDYGDGDAPPLPIKITAMNGSDDDDNGAPPPIPPDGSDDEQRGNGEFDEDEDDEDEEEEDEDEEIDKLPEFANDEAKALHNENKQLKELLEKVDTDVTETKHRLSIMEEHLKNVSIEVGHTTDLVNAKKKEIESEDHLTQLVVREAGRYQQEFKRLQESLQVSDEKLNLAQNAIFKGNEKMDAFKLEMNWNQEELEQWALAAKQKEDDNLALQKYTRADEVKIKEVTLLMEKLTQAVGEAKAKLENEATDTAARQIELDRTAEEFRAAHEERQVLVKQWQDTIEAMRARDATVQELAIAYGEERDRLAEQLKILSQQREHLDSLKNDNEDLENKILQLERGVQRRREERTSSQEKLQEFTDELDVVKHELQAGASALAKTRNENAASERSLEEKKKILAEARQAYQQTKKNLDDEIKATEKTELSAKEAEQRIADAELELKKREFLLSSIKDDTFKQSQALFALRQDEARMISEISGAQSSAKNLQGRIRLLDQESIRQQELIYNGEFQIQQMERKVSRGLGERSDEETKALKKEIATLETEVDAAKEQKKMLVAQCRKLNLELRAALRKKEVASKAALDLKNAINELESENESLGQTLDSLARKKEDQMVNNDVMRLEVKRLRDLLNNKTDKVFSLENRKQQLALSMEERKHEINVHQNVQRAQLRAAEEERHRVTIELGGRRQAVEKLRDKYETLCKVSGVRTDEDGGEPKSQAYYLIKAAQKREELQRQGDEMDQNIRTSEKEIKALTTTLKHLSNQNTNFRAAHQKVTLTSEDSEKIRQLDEQNKMTSDILFKKKKELSRLQTDLEEDGRRLEQVTAHVVRLEERNQHLINAKQQMESELELQRTAVEKISRRVFNLSQQHRQKCGKSESEETLQEKDFKCEAMVETMTNALYTLGQLSEEYPEIKDQLFGSLQEANLNIPTKPATRVTGDDPEQ